MKQLPFTIFKKGNRWYFYVRFRNQRTGEYLPVVSTKKETKADAMQTAFEWLKNGIPEKTAISEGKATGIFSDGEQSGITEDMS